MINDDMPQATAEQLAKMEEKLKLEKQLKSGADWFFWIAGLSVINSIIILFGGGLNFLIGLGISLVIAYFAEGFSTAYDSTTASFVIIVAFIINLLIAGIFVLFGYYARNRSKLGFVIGMVLYALDGLIFLFFRDFLSFGFHLFALLGLFSGYRAIDKLKAEGSVNIEHF